MILFTFLLSIPGALACSWAANIGALTSSFASQVGGPSTLTLANTFTYSGTDCTYSMVATATAIIASSAYVAIPVTYAFQYPSQPLVITYNFPGVTLSSLTSQGSILYISQTATGILTADSGGGLVTVTLPPTVLQTFGPTTINNPTTVPSTTFTSSSSTSTPTTTTTSSSSPSPTSTSSSTTDNGSASTPTPTSSSSGLSSGAIGGIAGGVVGGFLVLGALAFIFIRRRRTNDSGPRPNIGGDGPGDGGVPPQEKVDSPIHSPAIRYPEDDFGGPVGGRTSAAY